ncbi:hypothetical protein GCM10010211_62020 [Streptomyces albospinus]|uniref:Uncharacterized protein n=1 Tax=Streptomyces albospinus TaxID=285515 RepID=A0ABQ2VJW3_9ACTN|nr:hypothetical protein GCM10010211_62020 [Streptomyces albospinus]
MARRPSPGDIGVPAWGDEVGVPVSGSAEGCGGAECACESPPTLPQPVRTPEAATRTAPNQGQAGSYHMLRLLCSIATPAPSAIAHHGDVLVYVPFLAVPARMTWGAFQ